MKLNEITIRDPYIIADSKTKKYYMYASYSNGQEKGFQVYISDDLADWQGPRVVFQKNNSFWATEDYWAPEVHIYRKKYYLFGTFASATRKRTSQILVSDSPCGPFEIHSQPIGPDNWYVLDATLYIENGTPYAIFSREWLQDNDGTMCYVQLSDDLTKVVSGPFVMFRASQSGWSRSPCWNTRKAPIFVVDAPFFYEINGLEFLLWSSWSDNCNASYSVGVAYPADGVLGGKFRHELLKLPKSDSGHAMIFEDFEGKKRICFHENNSENGNERAAIYFVGVNDGKVVVNEK